MQNPSIFKHISQDTRTAVVAAFVEAIKAVRKLECPDLDETANALQIVGANLRSECGAGNGMGELMFAKVILDHANTRT